MSAMTIGPAVRGGRAARTRPSTTGRATTHLAAGRTAAGRTAAGRAAAGRTAVEGPLRLTARGRAVVWGLAVALATGVGGAAVSAQADGPRAATEVQRVVVAPGQTLWGLAAEVAAPGEDVRDVVLRLMELNELPAGGLQAGQTVVVPVG
ncbi:LysM peptidoglycan-binding domain-containing protein [Cellulomonas sp. 179-A 9B4 NHS]|uniref:LysM peptidoglycan-binding domain-containing protein n=1 Tax=Cellulomonas sp. 179-A 9B4 NHS TaxID=3142379 RepID=UPI0039A3B536